MLGLTPRTGRLFSAQEQLGLVVALPMGRLIRAQLFGVEPTDPLVLMTAAAAVLATAVAASVAPARRAARVDPAAALRQE